MKMEIAVVNKLVALSIVFGLVVADPASRFDHRGGVLPYPYMNTEESYNGYDIVLTQDDLPVRSALSTVSHIINSICSLTGYKFSALPLAVQAIEWLLSNALIIIIGTIVSLGFCKLTGVCNIAIDRYIPVGTLHELATPERLRTAEEFLFRAVQKYSADKKKRAAIN